MLSVVAVLIIIAAVVGSAFMTGMLLTLWHKIQRLESGEGPRPDVGLTATQVDRLIDQVQAVATDVDRLRERMDFTERLLTEGTGAEDPPDGS